MNLTNEQIQALKAAAEKALPAMQRLLMMPNNELFDEALLNADGDVDLANAFNLLAGPETILSLLAEQEADKALIAESVTLFTTLRDRIAELEARTLTVDLRKHLVNEVMIISQMDRQYSEGWCSANDWAILKIREACAIAGITLVVGGEDATNAR